MLTGLVSKIIKYGIPTFFALIFIVNVVSILVSPLQLNPLMPIELRRIGVIVPIVGLFVVPVGYYATKDTRFFKYGIPVVIGTPLLMLVLSWIILIPLFFISLSWESWIVYVIIPSIAFVILVTDILTGKISGRAWFRKTDSESEYTHQHRVSQSFTSSRSEILVGALVVVESPQERILHEERDSSHQLWLKSESILRSSVGASVPCIYRLERVDGQTRECFMTLGKGIDSLKRNLNTLHQIVSSNYPQYQLETHNIFRAPRVLVEQGVVSCLSGEPLRADDSRQKGDPLTVVAEAMMKQDNAILQITAIPVSSGIMGSMKRAYLRSKYRQKASQAQITVTRDKSGFFSKGTQESAVYTDMVAAEKADKVRRELDRYSASSACEVEVSIACWDFDKAIAESNSRLLVGMISGAIKPADLSSDFEIRTKKKSEDFHRLVSGQPVGEYTLLLPVEAAMLYTLPQTDLGTQIGKRSVFSTSTTPYPEAESIKEESSTVQDQEHSTLPPRKTYVNWRPEFGRTASSIILGNPLGQDRTPRAGLVWFYMQRMEAHLGIYGNTRSGKTWTSQMIVAQAIKNGLNTLILVPRKGRTWTRLLHLFPNLWVFTAGDSNTAPLRINIFRPPKNVPIETWMKKLAQIFSGLLPNDEVMSLHFDSIFQKVYRDCGWDIKKNLQGRTILLSDLWYAVEEIARTLPYGDELKANFYGALYTRIRSIMSNHMLVDMYNTDGGITWDEIVNNSLIIDMERLTDKKDSAFLMSLLAAGTHMYKMFNPSSRISNLLVLEEASYILKESTGQKFYGPNAEDTVLSLMIDMFTTCGENGLGVLIIEQLPNRLEDEIVKLIVNVITHSIGNESERRIVAGHIGVDEKRIDHIQQMKKGETIVFIEEEAVPKNVQIWPLDRMLEIPIPKENVSPETIKKHMEPILEIHPDFQSVSALPPEVIDRIQNVRPIDSAIGDKAESLQSQRQQSRLSETSEYLQQVDTKLGKYVEYPDYVENLAKRAKLAHDGDAIPLARMLIELSKDLPIHGVAKGWIAERLAIHSAEMYPSLLNPELLDIVTIVIRGSDS